MSHRSRVFAVVVVLGLMGVPSAHAQAVDPQAAPEPGSRVALIEQAEQAKFENLKPAAPGKPRRSSHASPTRFSPDRSTGTRSGRTPTRAAASPSARAMRST